MYNDQLDPLGVVHIRLSIKIFGSKINTEREKEDKSYRFGSFLIIEDKFKDDLENIYVYVQVPEIWGI